MRKDRCKECAPLPLPRQLGSHPQTNIQRIIGIVPARYLTIDTIGAESNELTYL